MLNELFVQRWKMLRCLPANAFYSAVLIPCSYTFNFLKDTGALADRFHWFTKERWHHIKFVHVNSPVSTQQSLFYLYLHVYVHTNNDTAATAHWKEALAVSRRPSL